MAWGIYYQGNNPRLSFWQNSSKNNYCPAVANNATTLGTTAAGTTQYAEATLGMVLAHYISGDLCGLVHRVRVSLQPDVVHEVNSWGAQGPNQHVGLIHKHNQTANQPHTPAQSTYKLVLCDLSSSCG